jgi:hypothetical protein
MTNGRLRLFQAQSSAQVNFPKNSERFVDAVTQPLYERVLRREWHQRDGMFARPEPITYPKAGIIFQATETSWR